MNESWPIFRLGELGRIVTGRTPPSSKPECFGDRYPFITPGDMVGQKWAAATDRSLSEEGADLLHRISLPPRAVAVSCIGWQMGKAIMVSRRSFSNQQLNTIVPTDDVHPDFLYYSLVPLRDQLLSLGSAAGVRTPILNKSAFSAIQIQLPPVAVQRRIADILSAYDDMIENNTRRIKILEEMAQRIYREWFVRFRFPGHENVPLVPSDLGPIPQGWSVLTTDKLVKRIPSGKKYDQKTVSSAGAVPVLDQGRSGVIGYHDDEPGVQASEDSPVIVFANHTCYQKILQYPFSAIQNVLPFVPSPETPRDIYWLHWATKDLIEFNDYKGHWPEFMAKRLLVPNAEVCSRFGQLVVPMVRLVRGLECKNANLRTTRDLLLPKLISGEISVEAAEDVGAELMEQTA